MRHPASDRPDNRPTQAHHPASDRPDTPAPAPAVLPTPSRIDPIIETVRMRHPASDRPDTLSRIDPIIERPRCSIPLRIDPITDRPRHAIPPRIDHPAGPGAGSTTPHEPEPVGEAARDAHHLPKTRQSSGVKSDRRAWSRRQGRSGWRSRFYPTIARVGAMNRRYTGFLRRGMGVGRAPRTPCAGGEGRGSARFECDEEHDHRHNPPKPPTATEPTLVTLFEFSFDLRHSLNEVVDVRQPLRGLLVAHSESPPKNDSRGMVRLSPRIESWKTILSQYAISSGRSFFSRASSQSSNLRPEGPWDVDS